MATQPEMPPEPSQPAQPTPAPTELPSPGPDIDMPDPGQPPTEPVTPSM